MSLLADSDYAPEVVGLFANLAHAGNFVVEPNAVQGQAGSRAHGFSVRVGLILESAFRQDRGKVIKARFEAYGCPHLLAATETLCRWLEGRTRSELENWHWRELESALAIPPAKRSRLLILEDALRRAAAAWDHCISAKTSAIQSER